MAMADNTDLPENERPQAESPDLVAEFTALGKKFAEAMQVAWQSEERHQLQGDIKEGLDRFASEVNDAFKTVRETEVAKKVEDGVQKAASEIKTGKVGEDVRRGMVTALRGLSDALDRMSSSFSPHEGEEPKE
jgi:hypothetical protein